MKADIENQLKTISNKLAMNSDQLKEGIQGIDIKVIADEALQTKIEQNQNKILEQQMKFMNKTTQMTEIKEDAFKKYCALSFEQQLYSIIKYGLKDIDEQTIYVTMLDFYSNQVRIMYKCSKNDIDCQQSWTCFTNIGCDNGCRGRLMIHLRDFPIVCKLGSCEEEKCHIILTNKTFRSLITSLLQQRNHEVNWKKNKLICLAQKQQV